MKRNAHSGLFIFVGNKHQLRSLVISRNMLIWMYVFVGALLLLLHSLSRADSLLFFHFPFNCVLVLHSVELMLFSFFVNRSIAFPTWIFFALYFRLVWMSCTCTFVCSLPLTLRTYAPFTYVFAVFRNTRVPLHRKARKQRSKLCSCSVKIKTMKNRNDEDGADDARCVYVCLWARWCWYGIANGSISQRNFFHTDLI